MYNARKSVDNFFLRLFGIFIVLTEVMRTCQCLSSEERGELARKFKYYHKTVRPHERFNLIETINGTYFSLNSELEILQSRVLGEAQLYFELLLIVHYHDDRLVLRELPEIVTLPHEFEPWLPEVELVQNWGPSSSSSSFNYHKTLHLDPKIGQITLFYRISGSVTCFSFAWKHPFQRYFCGLEFNTEKNERIFLRVARDLRPSIQLNIVTYSTEEWPNLAIKFTFTSQWHFAIVRVYLPSLLLFTVALCAQWRRRKVQVLVSVTSIISIIVIQTCQQKPSINTISLQDVWLSGLLIHLIFILTIDLLLPSKRITYTKATGDNNCCDESLYFAKNRAAALSTSYRKSSAPSADLYLPSNQQIRRNHLKVPYPIRNYLKEGEVGNKQVRFQQRPLANEAQKTSIHEQLVLDMYTKPKFEEVDLDEKENILRFSIPHNYDEEEDSEENENNSRGEPIWLDNKGSMFFNKGRTRRSSLMLYPSKNGVLTKRSLAKRQIYRVTMGRKKKIALIAIFVCFMLFVTCYVASAIYAIRS